ncbi:amino acid ABC transporter substrate-binding protein [Candidatus Bathyarchaeota archaeon]|nr:amino acid ABC transporter substrate-binding protein [Candidatus Bathyarchaeota archaeon]
MYDLNGRGIAAIALIIGIVVGFSIGWFAPALLPPAPAPSLVAQIQARGSLYVGTSSDWPPFEIYNTTTDQYEGFDIDLCEMIAAHLGVTVTWFDMDFDALPAACIAGTIDMIAAAMFVTPERAEQLAHSVPYIRTNQVVVVKGNSTLTITDLEDLEGYTVGVQSGTVEDLDLTDLVDAGVGINLVRYARADIMLADLEAGGLDATYVDEPVFTVYSGIYFLKTIYTYPAPPTALFCRWENPDLLQEINIVILNAFADGTMDALIAQWFG